MRKLFVIATLVCTACGAPNKSGGGDGTTTDPATDKPADDGHVQKYPSLAAADAASLPACAADTEGALAYVKAEAKFKACEAGAWADIEIKGEKGDAGNAGADGKDGLNGKDGVNGVGMSIAAQYSCSGTDDIDLDDGRMTGGTTLAVVKFENGDYSLQCMDYTLNLDFTYTDHTSNSAFFRADSMGVTSGAISCLPFYTLATFNIETKQAHWRALSGGDGIDVACSLISGSDD